MAGFQLSGTAPEVYERYFVPAFLSGCADLLLAAAPPRPGERVLDLACGTGLIARRVRTTERSTVVGIDVNESMLAHARTLAPDADWRQSAAEDLPLADSSVDTVYCQQGLQFFDDPAKALREAWRVLVPGGRLALAVWRPAEYSPGFVPLIRALDRIYGTDAGDVLRAPFAAGDRALLASLVKAADFTGRRLRIGVLTARFPSIVDIVRYEIGASPLAELVSDIDPLVEAVLPELERRCDDDGVAFPMETWLITATR
jgi:SAM-dependent methyltransferase